jgi:uncharacterized phiE125 gp8 family phage protein
VLIRIANLGSSPVTVDDLKEHALIEQDDQDGVIETMLGAAIEFLEEKAGGHALRRASWELRVPDWPCGADAIEIPLFPVREVTALKYFDDDGAEQTIDAADYTVEPTSEGASIFFDYSYSLPSLKRMPHPVRVEFDAGYDDPNESGSGADPALAFPDRFKLAALMLAAAFYEHREEIAASETFRTEIAESLVHTLKIFR